MATNLKDIADQYAKAIFELSSEQGNVEDTRKDLDTLKVVFENNPNFVTIVSSNDINNISYGQEELAHHVRPTLPRVRFTVLFSKATS